MANDAIEWRKRDRAHGDPEWHASVGGLSLVIVVECEWCWGWTIFDANCIELAGGDLDAGGDEAVELDDWDYQNVEVAQRRCECVARALLMEVHDGD
jgi:hypothetical protein